MTQANKQNGVSSDHGTPDPSGAKDTGINEEPSEDVLETRSQVGDKTERPDTPDDESASSTEKEVCIPC